MKKLKKEKENNLGNTSHYMTKISYFPPALVPYTKNQDLDSVLSRIGALVSDTLSEIL